MLNLISLLVYVPLDSSFISTHFFVLNLEADLMRCLKNLLFFDIPLLYFYTNLNSLIIYCLSSGDMYLFWYILLFRCFVILSETFSKHSLFYQQFCYQLNRQLLLLFFELLFLMQFLLHPL